MPATPSPLPPDSDALTTRAARDQWAEAAFKDRKPAFNHPVLLLGDEPFEAGELAAFLRRYKIEAFHFDRRDDLFEIQEQDTWSGIAARHAPVVVLGRMKWFSLALVSLRTHLWCRPEARQSGGILHDFLPYWIEKTALDGEVIFRRSPDCYELSFITQEQLLNWLFSGNKPQVDLPLPRGNFLSATLIAIEKFRDDVLRSGKYFPWPSTAVGQGDGRVEEADWPQIGLLSFLGYHVGAAGTASTARRQILSKVYTESRLPQVESAQYMAEWGGSLTAERLRKTAETLAAFCRLAKKKQTGTLWIDMRKAISDWEADLAWLKTEHYDGRFDGRFKWPTT